MLLDFRTPGPPRVETAGDDLRSYAKAGGKRMRGGGAARLVKFTWAANGTLAMVALLFVVVLASYTRFTGDDFGAIGSVRLLGFWHAQSFWWHTWTGRFSATATTSVFQLLGPRMAWGATAVSLGLWVTAVALLLRRFVSGSVARLSLALILVGTTLLSMPSLQELVFWQTGVLTYTFPLGAAVLALCLAVPLEQQSQARFWAKALFFVAGGYLAGFSETSTAVLIAAAFFLLSWTVAARRRHSAPLWLLGGLIAGFLLMTAAPGNAVRLAKLPAEPAIGQHVGAFTTILLLTAYMGFRIIRFYPALAALALLAPMLAGVLHGEDGAGTSVSFRRIARLLLLAGVVFTLMCASVLPGALITSRPPDRALLWTQAVLILGIAYFGWLAGRALPARAGAVVGPVAAVLVLVAAVLGCLAPARQFWSLRPAAAEFARQWDEMDAQARRAVATGKQDVILPAVPSDFSSVYLAPGLISPGIAAGDELSVHAEHWVNQTAAAYYGCRSIRVDSSHGDQARELRDPLPVQFPGR